MRPRPRPERVRTRHRPKNLFEAEARHIREQLSVYEHEDQDIDVQNIVFSKQPIHNGNDCRWLYCEY